MKLKENKSNLKKEFEISLEQNQKNMNNNNINLKEEEQREKSEDEIFMGENENENEIILKKDDEDKELKNNNNEIYNNEIFIIENKNKKVYNKFTNKKPIYTKIKSESSRNQKNTLSNLIYKSGKVFPRKNNTTYNLNNYIMNTAKYSIKNPIKEKSKKKFKKNIEINNNHSFYNNNYNNYYNSEGISNLEELQNINYINQKNYFDRTENELYNNNNKSDLNIIVKKSKNPKNNIINLQKQPKQNNTKNISLNNFHGTKFKYAPNNEKAAGRITYICDYSQEDNKDSYYIESPNEYNRHISLYQINPKLKKKKNKANKYIKGDELKKEIEDSKKKFEKIREIEREIKNYFNLNGLDIINRELYDQSATLIQAAFRAYLLRINLYAKLNLYMDLKSGIDIIKNIFLPRKINYWEIFINSIFGYINTINTNMNIDNIYNEDENEVNLNSEKYQYLNDEFNEEENSRIKYVKKIPTSYKYKKSKNKINNENLLMVQSCISLNFEKLKDIKYNKQEELLNKIIKENEELKKQNEELRKNNNIIKNTQESVELKLNDDLNEIVSKNKDIKLIKLKYILKLIDLKYKNHLYKHFMKLYNKSILLKYDFKIKIDSKNRRNKIIKRLILNKEKNLRNLKYKMFFIFYYKGFINIKKNDEQNATQIDEKDKSEDKIKDEANIIKGN